MSLLISDKRLFSATGIHSVQLLNSSTICFGQIAPDPNQKIIVMWTRDMIVITMIRIKLAISFSALAALFDLDSVIVLSKVLKCAILWSDKELILKNMPKCSSKYRCTRVILDAYEIPVEKPKCITCRVCLYSHYKKNFTSKVVMLCAPSGLTTHCSPAFGGRASEKVVILNSGVYGMCDPVDGIMVDKGFDTDTECQDHLLKLIRPPFMRKIKFSSAESVECGKIARARVQVVRIILRVLLNLANQSRLGISINLDNQFLYYRIL
ncbi:Shikimate kinase [Frankliniella fusca]|uniref:Shikimate kinase n=1 Tax=Frankliniella fusca TaxID=407009 RepID=A0AAE1HDC7_9NEOP|nr:Shikimate kinase [Frankliniella fusca]